MDLDLCYLYAQKKSPPGEPVVLVAHGNRRVFKRILQGKPENILQTFCPDKQFDPKQYRYFFWPDITK